MTDAIHRQDSGGALRGWGAASLAALGLALVCFIWFDGPLHQWATGVPEAWRRVFLFITRWGKSDWILWPSLVALILLSLARLGVAGRRKVAVKAMQALAGFVFFGVGLPSLIAFLGKYLIGRARPEHFADLGAHWVRPFQIDPSLAGFPSGHSATSFGLAMVIGLLVPALRWPALIAAGLIGVSRVMLGAHYPSDVIGGALVGLWGAYAVALLFTRRGFLFRRRNGRLTPRRYGAIVRLLRPHMAAR